MVVVAAPLWDGGEMGGNIAGTVIAVLDARILSEIVTGIQISEHGGAYIIDSEGTEIGAEDYEFVEQRWNTIKESENNAGLRSLAKIEKKMISGEKGFGTYLFQGTPKYLGYVPVGINGWSLAVTAPISDFMDGTIWSIIITVLMLIVMSVVGIRITARLGNKIGDAVRVCTERLHLLAEGDLATAVEILDTDDETKSLENSTRAIVQSLQTIIGDISYMLGEMAGSNYVADTLIGKEAYVGAYREILSSLYVLKSGMNETLHSVVDASEQVDAGAEQLAG